MLKIEKFTDVCVKRENQIVYYILYIRFRCQKNIEIQRRDICFSSFCIS